MPFEERGPVAGSGQSGALSVSQALAIAKGALEGIRITIVGEVSEVSAKRGYKAVYFTVKDASSSLSCLIWNNVYRTCGVELQVGQLVEITGRFSLYAARGTMNFDVRKIQLAGEGRLRMQVAQLARKLQAEGLMDPARKRPLPEYPRVIGLVTSPHGDAVHDVLRTLRRRWPMARVAFAGVQVEGQGAPEAIIAGLEAVARTDAQFVLLVRGGGSYESLMPFNDERLARTIASFPIPVVTGIGHEPDTFIADMVADVRGSTPTWAAAECCPAADEVSAALSARSGALQAAMLRTVERAEARVAYLAERPVMRDPNQLLAQDSLNVDALAQRLGRALPTGLDRDKNDVRQLKERLQRSLRMATADHVSHVANSRIQLKRSIARVGERERMQAGKQADRLRVALSGLVPRFQQEAGMRAARLNDLSPLAVLGRGYSIARDEQGHVVKSVQQTQVDDLVRVSVSDGTLDCRVQSVQRIDSETVDLK